MSRAVPHPVEPPARRLRLLANLFPGLAVVFGLLTLSLLGGAVADVRLLATGPTPPTVVGIALAVSLVAAVLTGVITYRLAVEAPRTIRLWNQALAERVEVLRRR